MGEVTPKRPRGRPPADPSGAKVKVSVHLSPAERDHLRGRYGTEYAGLRELVRRDMTGKKRTESRRTPRRVAE